MPLLDDEQLERIADRLAEKLAARGKAVEPRLMDIPSMASYLGRSVAAVQHMVKRGTLPVTKIDGKVQIDRSIVDQLIKARTV